LLHFLFYLNVFLYRSKYFGWTKCFILLMYNFNVIQSPLIDKHMRGRDTKMGYKGNTYRLVLWYKMKEEISRIFQAVTRL
jgi:hypothetical protein